MLTSPKENELVEIPIVSPLPAGQLNPMLAHWSYGLGRSVAFTSDAGRRWAKTWPDWQSYAAFWSQVIRWSMRPADRGNLTLNVPPRARPDQGRRRRARQEQPVPQFPPDPRQHGRPRPEVRPDRAGADGAGPLRGARSRTPRPAATTSSAWAIEGADNVQGVISSGVSVPYSDEYRELRSNPTTLESLASVTDGKVATGSSCPTAGSTWTAPSKPPTTSAATPA